MSFTCQHCGENPDNVSRTGDKRYACGACSKVVTYDNLAPHLDELNVIDKRKKEEDDDESDTGEPTNSGGENVSEEETQEASGGLSERELIRQRGHEGLREVKKERLKHWLSVTDNVGSTTESRITMVFDSDESYRQNPNALFNLLDDELSSSSSYINTIVNQVFQPEHEHKDLLINEGYRPYFERNNATQGRQPMENSQNGSQGFEPTNPTPQPQQTQQQPQQQQQSQQASMQAGGSQAPQSSTDDGISREEVMEMMSAANQESQSSGRQFGDAASESLNKATEEAIANVAENMGGFLEAGQQMVKQAMIEYAKENPEVVVENMGIFETFLNNDDESSEPEKSEQDKRIDDAVMQAQQGGTQGQNHQAQNQHVQQQNQQYNQRATPNQQQQPQQSQEQQNRGGESLRDPRRDNNSTAPDELDVNKEEHVNNDSGFEPDNDILSNPEEVNDSEEEVEVDNDRNSNSSDNSSSSSEEEDGDAFDELFGDISE